MGVEDEFAGPERDRPPFEIVEQQAPPPPAARLRGQVEVLDLVAPPPLAVGDQPDAAAAHRIALIIFDDDEHPGRRLEGRGAREGRGVDDALVSEPDLTRGEVRGEKRVSIGGVDGGFAQRDHLSSVLRPQGRMPQPA